MRATCCGSGSGLAAFEGGEALAGQAVFFGAREVVDEILQAGLSEAGLLQVDQGQRATPDFAAAHMAAVGTLSALG